MSISSEIFISASDQSYIYYYRDGEAYFIRGKPISQNPGLEPGEIFIQNSTNNIRWRAASSTQVYQAKGVNIEQDGTKLNNEFYVGSEDKSLNIIRSGNRFLLSTNLIRNGNAGASVDEGLNIYIILDASGSMSRALGSTTRMEAAKQEINKLVNYLPRSYPNLNVGFGTLGGRSSSSCAHYPTLIPMDGVDRERFPIVLQGILAVGGTPIAGALNDARPLFAQKSGEKIIILITDGEETCAGGGGGSISTQAGWDAVRSSIQALINENITLKIIGVGLSSATKQQYSTLVNFFESTETQQGLEEALKRSIVIKKNEIKAFKEDARQNVITVDGKIDPTKTSRTNRHYDIAYCRVEGAPGEFYNFQISNMRSGYTYTVTYDYGESVVGTFSCPTSGGNQIFLTNRNQIIRSFPICSGSVGTNGTLCSFTNEGFFWSGSGSPPSSSSCSSESQIGSIAYSYGWSIGTSCTSSFVNSLGTCGAANQGSTVCLRTGSTSTQTYSIRECRCLSASWSPYKDVSSCAINSASCSSCADVGKFQCIAEAESFCSSFEPLSITDVGCGIGEYIYRFTERTCNDDSFDERVVRSAVPNTFIEDKFNKGVSWCNDPGGSSATYYTPTRWTRFRSERYIQKRTVLNYKIRECLGSYGFVLINANSTTPATNPVTTCNASNVGRFNSSANPIQYQDTGTRYTCSQTAQFICTGIYRERYCNGQPGVPVSWFNFKVTDDDGQIITQS
jgi:Mg-chelatase subunit ChlD